VPASARFPACCLSHCYPQCLLLVIPSAAVAEEVLPRLGHSPSTPPAFVVVSVAKPHYVDSSGRMPGLQSVEPGGQQFHACHRDRSLGPRLALECVAEVLAALVGLPPRLHYRPCLGDSSSPVRGRGLWPLYHSASECVSGQIGLAVRFLVSGDAGVSRDPVDLGCDAVGEETPRPSVDPPRQSLPWARLQVCRSSNCALLVAEDWHRLHSRHRQCSSLLDRHIKHKPDRPQLGVEDFHMSGAQNAAARPPFISVFTHHCSSHSAIV